MKQFKLHYLNSGFSNTSDVRALIIQPSAGRRGGAKVLEEVPERLALERHPIRGANIPSDPTAGDNGDLDGGRNAGI